MSETEKGWDRDRGRRVSDDLMDKLNAASKGSNVLTLDPSAIADIYGELIDRRDEARALREALLSADTRLRERGDLTNHPARELIASALDLPRGTDGVPSLWRPGDRTECDGKILEYIETELEGEKWRVIETARAALQDKEAGQ